MVSMQASERGLSRSQMWFDLGMIDMADAHASDTKVKNLSSLAANTPYATLCMCIGIRFTVKVCNISQWRW